MIYTQRSELRRHKALRSQTPNRQVFSNRLNCPRLSHSHINRHSSLITRRSSLDVTRHSTFVREEQHQQERTHTARTQANSIDIQRLRLCPVSTKDSNATTIHVDSTRQDRSHTPDHSQHARSSSIFLLLFSHPHVSISVK